jgi:hypothetical protein
VDADQATAPLRPTTAARPNSHVDIGAGASNIPRGCETEPGQHQRHGGLPLIERAFLSAAAAYFHDRYRNRHLRPHVVHRTATRRQSCNFRRCRSGAPARAHAGRTRRRADHRLRHTKRSNFTSTTTQRSAARLPHAEGRLRLPARRQRHQLVLPGGFVQIIWEAPSRSGGVTGAGTVRLLRGERSPHTNKAGSEHHSLYVQDSVDRRQPS